MKIDGSWGTLIGEVVFNRELVKQAGLASQHIEDQIKRPRKDEYGAVDEGTDSKIRLLLT